MCDRIERRRQYQDNSMFVKHELEIEHVLLRTLWAGAPQRTLSLYGLHVILKQEHRGSNRNGYMLCVYVLRC